MRAHVVASARRTLPIGALRSGRGPRTAALRPGARGGSQAMDRADLMPSGPSRPRGACRPSRVMPSVLLCRVGVVRTALSGLRSKSLTTVLGIITARRKRHLQSNGYHRWSKVVSARRAWLDGASSKHALSRVPRPPSATQSAGASGRLWTSERDATELRAKRLRVMPSGSTRRVALSRANGPVLRSTRHYWGIGITRLMPNSA